MGDGKKRAPSVAGDIERVYAGRHTPRHGVPQHVDHEATPPPLEPPPLDADETIPPAISAQLGMLHDVAARNARAIGKLWDGRDSGERIERLDTKLDMLSGDITRIAALIEGFIHPVVKAMQAETHSISLSQSANQARASVFWEHEWPAALKALDGLDTRLDRIERQQEDHARDLRAFGAQVQAAGAVGNALDVRVTAIERQLVTDRTEREKTLAVETAISRRDKWWLAKLVAAVAVFVGIAREALPALIHWIRG